MPTTRTAVSIALAMSVLLPCQVQGAFVEQFRTDNAGWLDVTVNNSGGIGISGATYNTFGPGLTGYITGPVTNSPDRLYGMQPADTHAYGSMSDLLLTTDYRIDGQITGPQTPMVRFYVGSFSGGRYDYFVSSDAFSWNPNTGPDWATFQVPLVAGNFIEWPNAAAHSRTFEQVVAAPEDIGLVFTGAANLFGSAANLGFSSESGATISVTNFGTVGSLTRAIPEPSTLAALALGGCMLLRRRR